MATRFPTLIAPQQQQATSPPNPAHSLKRREVLHGLATATVLLPATTTQARAFTPRELPIPRHDVVPDLSITRVVLGRWQLSGGHRGDAATDRTSGSRAVDDIVTAAERFGLTTQDTADIYGQSQKLVGQARLRAVQDKVKFEALTKLCVFSEFEEANRAPEAFVSKKIDAAKRAMQYGNDEPLDCVQLYWHDYEKPGLEATVEALCAARDKGLIRSVGITNMSSAKIEAVVDRVGAGGISLNQIQYSVLDGRPLNGQMELCRDQNIGVLAFGTTAGGFLSDRYLGMKASDVVADTYSKRKYASIIGERGGWIWFQGLLELLAEIAARRGVSIAQVAQRYVLDRGAAAAIVGARNANHLAEAASLFDFRLTNDDVREIERYVLVDRPTSDVYEWERGLSRW